MVLISSIHRMLRLLNPNQSKKPGPFKYREIQGKTLKANSYQCATIQKGTEI